MKKTRNRAVKFILRILLIFFAVILLLPLLLYFPPVQNFARNRLEIYAARNLNMQLSVERLRLSFPLRLSVRNAMAVNALGDTLFRVGNLSTDVALWPLFRSEVLVRHLHLDQAAVHLRDTATRLELTARLDKLRIGTAKAMLRQHTGDISGMDLADGEVFLLPATVPDTTARDSVALRWKIRVERLNLSNMGFVMQNSVPDTSRMEIAARVPKGIISDVSVALENIEVVANGAKLYDASASLTKIPFTESFARPSAAGALRPALNSPPPSPVRGFDLNRMRVDSVNTSIDSFYFQGQHIRGIVRELELYEQSGLRVLHAEGRFDMDSARIGLQNFVLRTPRSSVKAGATVGRADVKPTSEMPLDLNLSANLDLNEVMSYLPVGMLKSATPAPAARRGQASSLQQVLAGKTIVVGSRISGTLGQLNIASLGVAMPGHFNISASGNVRSVLNTDAMNGQVRVNGSLASLDFLTALLPDTALRRRVRIPDHMQLTGDVRFAPGNYMPTLRLTVGGGALALEGEFAPRTEQYRADLKMTDFPLYRFLPHDSVGMVALELEARGRGFDPMASATALETALDIEHFDYKGYNYENTALRATLRDHLFAGKLSSDGEALKLNLAIDGFVSRERYEAAVKGRIAKADLYRMHFATDTTTVALWLDVSGRVIPDAASAAKKAANASAAARKASGRSADSMPWLATASFTLSAVVDSIRVQRPGWAQNLRRTTLEAVSGPGGLHASVRSGDLALDFDTPATLDSLLVQAGRVGKLIPARLKAGDFGMTGLNEQLPPLTMTMSAKRDNMLHEFISHSGIDFSRVRFDTRSGHNDPFKVDLEVNHFLIAGIRIDTAKVNIRQEDDKLDYAIRLANAPGNLDSVGLILLEGTAVHENLTLHALQQDRNGRTGFDFGLQAMASDTAVRVTMTPHNPTLGFAPWSVNPDNFILYRFASGVYADLRLMNEDQSQYVKVLSQRWPDEHTDALKLDIAGINIGNTLRLFPSAPAIGGIFNANLLLAMARGAIDVEGEIRVDSLSYDKRLAGDVKLDVVYHKNAMNTHRGNLKLLLGEKEILLAEGRYYAGRPQTAGMTDSLSLHEAAPAGDPLVLSVKIPGLPLTLANAFLDDAARLSGTLAGEVDIKGKIADFGMNGWLQLVDTKVDVLAVGTTFRFSDQRIDIVQNLLNFEDYTITAPNNQSLFIDGSLDMKNFSSIIADLAVTANDFEVVNVSRNRNSLVYGQASIDLNTTVRGPLNELLVRGNVMLRGGTDVTYTLRNAPTDIRSEQQDLVTFISFLDSVSLTEANKYRPLRTRGVDLLVNLTIAEGVRFTVNLSENGDNRIELRGGGTLAYAMNRLGDRRLTGRYVLSGGTVFYRPPIISQKEFAINEGSFVEWSGDPLNPTVDITAVESVRTNVTTDIDNNTRQVIFHVTIIIRNMLQDLDVTFDLAAPADMAIQNQLTTMTAEQRSVQAINLLINNTFTGPGTVARANTVNPLNTFIERELNQWARNNLRGVDLSFGIDSYNQIGDQGESTRTNYSYQLSKNLFNDRVRVVVGGSISTDSQRGTNLTDNLVGDVSIEYMLNERKNMYLRLFRNSAYESILEGQVVSTGVGFVVHKKLYRMSDLFRFGRDPETRMWLLQQKTEKRELRKEEREEQKQAREHEGENPGELPEGTPADTTAVSDTVQRAAIMEETPGEAQTAADASVAPAGIGTGPKEAIKPDETVPEGIPSEAEKMNE